MNIVLINRLEVAIFRSPQDGVGCVLSDYLGDPLYDLFLDAQDEADRQNVFRLTAIGVKEEIAEWITKIVRKDTTNPILRTTENSDF